MNKHTPGPWTIEHIKGLDLGASAEILAGKDRRIVIAQVWKTDDALPRWSMDKTGQANAALIAAAPELLEACKLLRDEIHSLRLLDVKKHFSLCVADAAAGKAIAKAEPK